MTAGLQILNDHGTYQIDETYRNLVLSQKFTFSTTGDHSFTVSGCTNPVLVLYSADAGGIAMLQSSVSSGAYTWRVNGIGEAYVFDNPPAATAHGAGLQVFDATGQLVYETGLLPMRIRDQLVQLPSWDRLWYPTQTMGVNSTMFFAPNTFSTVEPMAAQSVTIAPYAKTSGQKWGWIANNTGLCWFWDDSFANDFGHPGENNGGFKSLPSIFASGDNFKFFMRDYGKVAGGEYAPPNSSSSEPNIVFVDLTGL